MPSIGGLAHAEDGQVGEVAGVSEMQPAAVQARVAERLVRARVSVVTLPQTNLWLQEREVATAVHAE